ncbi:MAG TPA: Rieske 2Fe-2S domain-containing protein [Polyangiaceae bacterium]|nr:Rieske 2Fe-2S domain-containing protein [Polyangiaceae bacterium]
MSVSLPLVSAARGTAAGLPAVPEGWYVAALARDLRVGEVLTRPMFGRDVVVFRTESGAVGALDSVCPHLGAHLGRGGKVCGESLRCPFHGFEFDRSGACVRTAYGGAPPRRARAGVLPAIERNGFVLVWSGARPPSWEVPALAPEGYSTPDMRTFRLRGHPQETTENSVDIGHFTVVHGFSEVVVEAPLVTEGPRLTAAYSMRHNLGVPVGVPILGAGFRTRFAIEAWGLGYSFVDVTALGLRTRHWVLATPVGGGEIDLSLGVSVPTLSLRTRAGRALARSLAAPLRRTILALFVRDTRADFPIWDAKRYVAAPTLAKGDGPIGRYRAWAGQFAECSSPAVAP